VRARRGQSQPRDPGDPHVTGRPPFGIRRGPTAGVVIHDPAGNLGSLPFSTGSGGRGGTGTLPTSIPGLDVVEELIATAVGAALAGVANAGSHIHGLMRVLGDGATTTFDLLDIAEYLLLVAIDGLIADPATHALSADRSQIVFAVAPTAGQVIVITYVIASV